jgi:maltose O-acetyltransferase
MFSLKESIIEKLRGALNICLGSRLCPNTTRRRLLALQGWQIGRGSTVRWGIDPTALRVSIGKHCFVGPHSFFDGRGTITIADNVRIGSYLRVLSTTHPIEHSVQRRIFGVDIDLDTRIEFGCWLGAGVTVLPGVTIREGCVIAAGAVVAQDTAPNGLYGGVPAKRIRNLPIAKATKPSKPSVADSRS